MWLFGIFRTRPPGRSKPTYDAYPDRAKPAPRPPRKGWIERLEEKLADYERQRRERGERPYDPYEERPDR